MGERELVHPPAVQMNTRRIIAVGSALFFLAFVVALPFWTWLGEHGHRDWLWTALAGWLLGLAGYTLTLKHRRDGRTT